jgi:putative pyruvate formate lyase activating enzyme
LRQKNVDFSRKICYIQGEKVKERRCCHTEESHACRLCPRECGVDRRKQIGYCGAGPLPRIAKVMLHPWEEPCICYGKGSGAVFFSGCQLRCVFCQNHKISHHLTGEERTAEELAELFLFLQEEGACNLNLVSPSPYWDTVIPALVLAKKKGLALCVVINCGGYESVDALRRLDGLADIYLPDYKFADPFLAKTYASAENYPEHCRAALQEMKRQCGAPQWDGEHLMRGVCIRHLILPGAYRDSLQILENIHEDFGTEGCVLSLMRQYTPLYRAGEFPALSRKLTTMEYEKVLKKAQDLQFRFIYTQQKSSASDAYVPSF